MKSKYYAQYLLRALDGEDLRLDQELSGLVELGGRMRHAVPTVPSLGEDARRRIYSSAVSPAGEPAVPRRIGGRVPRMAWAAAAVMAMVIVAVVVFIFINMGGPTVIEAREIASLRLDRGEVTIRNEQGEKRPASSGEAIADGDVLIAAADTRGIVEFESGSFMRLEGEAEIGFYSEDDGVVTEIFEGKSYHRVVDGTRYTARSGEVTVTARGTAFTFDVEGEAGKVISVHSSVEVRVDTDDPDDWTSDLEEGDVFIYGDESEGQVLDVTREELDSEWLRWNKSLDEALGLPVGALSVLDEAGGGEVPPPPEQPPAPAEEPAQPAPQPQPSPSPSPQPTPPAPVEKSVSLSASARQGAVDFSWSLTGYSDFQGFKLCRSESNPAPSYPGDWWKYIDGAATRSTTDTSVQAGHTYYYRLAVYSNGAVLGYSNAVQVTVPGSQQELSITLSASVESGKVKLSWSVSGEGTYSGFKVCRSETNPSPSYPGDTCTLVDAAARYYADTSVASGKTYYYRVGIYKDGTIIKYSNAVQVTVP